jgi:hypothetical protein
MDSPSRTSYGEPGAGITHALGPAAHEVHSIALPRRFQRFV